MPPLRIVAIVLLLLAGVAARRTLTMPWAGSSSPTGAAFEIAPLGITRVDSDGARRSCRWHSGTGDVALCAPAGADSPRFYRLELTGPLLALASWLLLGSAVLAVLPVPGAGVATVLVAGAGTLAAGIAAAVFAGSVDGSLATLAGLGVSVEGTGWTLARLVPVVAGAGTVLAWVTRLRIVPRAG